ncbi:hypothetical protein P3G55_09170 [Leptospira sp. 96542]|nr:hypothetical protein [Leptospira sp. 96542]
MIFKERFGLALFCILVSLGSFQNLSAQFSGYENSISSAYLGGLGSNGSVSVNELGSFYGNTAGLASKNRNLLDAGAYAGYASGDVSSLYLAGGVYFGLGEKWGLGFRAKPVFQRSFPANERFSNHAFQGIFSYHLTDSLSLGINFGPSVSVRPGGYSSYSWNLSFGIQWELGKWKVGGILESPGAYRYEKYLGSMYLKERLPERLFAGVSYEVMPEFTILLEGSRIFWENAYFDLNENNEKPPYPVKTMFGGNLSFAIGKKDELQLLLGIGREHRAEAFSRLKPMDTVSTGVSGPFFPSLAGEGFYYSVFLMRSGLGVRESEGAETRSGFQFQSRY